MAVPSSGTLSMLGLAREKVYDNYSSTSTPTAPYSMYDLVNGGNTNGSGVSFDTTNTASTSYPDTSTPHQMSEWYSYDHDAVGYTAFAGTSSQSTAAAGCSPSRSNTYYHNGSNTLPQTGDTVFTNAAGTTALSNGYYGICIGPGGTQGSTPAVIRIVSTPSAGYVSQSLLCFPAPSPNPCPP